MRLKVKFLIYIILLNLIILILSRQYFEDRIYLFFGVELLVVISIIIAFNIYKHYIRPYNLISSLVKSMKEREFSLRFMKSNVPEINQMVEVFNEMIDQLREERKTVQEQHYFLEKLTEAMPIGILVLDANNRIKNVNPFAEKYLGTTGVNLSGKTLGEIDSPLTRSMDKLREGESFTCKPDGIERYRITKSHFIDKGFHNHFILIEELTREVLETEKAAYGKVIRMMSHEVNNSVGAINSLINSLHYYKTELTEEDKNDYNNALEVILKRNEHMNHFMNNFANVIRIPEPDIKPCDLSELLNNIHKLMEPYCRSKKIKLNLDKSNNAFMARMDIQQMEQLLVNVIKNAAESIDSNGEINIRFDDKNTLLLISDSGNGITPQQETHLFTPFYSSKEGGQGIGLTICREIAMKHDFRIALKNRPEGGAVFSLQL